jgi:hypothetical protein
MRRNLHNFFVWTIIFSTITAKGYSQHILASFKLTVSATAEQTAAPQSIDLDGLTQAPDSGIVLVELKDGKKQPIAAQIEKKGRRYLHWMVLSGREKRSVHTYEIIEVKAPGLPDGIPSVNFVKDNTSLLLRAHGKPLVNYQYATNYPPPGIDTVFKRSGFIHPLYAPHGQPLTRINAPDHYHHYGLWDPWTHVQYKGKMIDFWNLNSKQGTVRFSKFISVTDGPVFSEYQVFHEHVIFEKNGTETIPMTEVQTVRVYQPGEKDDYYIMDITIQLNCTTDSAVILKEYRYGGLGWRATEKWDNQNSETLTSEGKTRKDADGSKARWVIVQGKIDADYAGAVMMSHPGNYNYPEPLRIWPENQNGRGDVYANFSPTKDMDWRLLPGKDYVLRYRFLVFNGHVNKEQAENAWQQYADPAASVITVSKK